jgi:hypothetical protein
MLNLRSLLFLLALLLGTTLQFVHSETTTKDNNDDDSKDDNDDDSEEVIRIVGYADGSTQRLPTHYVLQYFSRWVLLEKNSLEKIPSTGDDDDKGFVNPSSISDLWWPVDIEKMQMRPSLDIVLQHGTPKYAASGLDVRVPFDNKDWRNHGMNSQPLARQWTLFENVAKPNFHIETFVEVVLGDDGETEEFRWDNISSSTTDSIRESVEKLGVLLSGLDESSPLSKGYHIISIPTTQSWADLPVMENIMDKPYMMVCLGTSWPDARALLDTKPYVAARMGTTILAVNVSPTAPGGESPHLPEAYRALYKA